MDRESYFYIIFFGFVFCNHQPYTDNGAIMPVALFV